MNSVYNNMLSTYAPFGSQKPVVHKQTELQKHYQAIIAKAKSTPLYLLNFSDEMQEYALNVKEMALEWKGIVKGLSSEGADSPFYRKEAVSGNPDSVEAEIVTTDYDDLPEPFAIKVNQTAGPQINYGRALYAHGRNIKPDTYKFEGKIEGKRYAFSLVVKEESRNLDVETRLAKYLTNADVGLEAEVERDSRGDMIRMVIRSKSTGDNGNRIFEFTDSNLMPGQKGIVDTLELNEMVTAPQNAEFELNGESMTAMTNRFVMNDSVRLMLYETTETEIPVSYQVDAQAALEEIQKGISSYNDMIRKSRDYSQVSGQYPKLSSELTHLVRPYQSELESVGVRVKDKNEFMLDTSLAYEAISSGEMQRVFSQDSPWIQKILQKAEQIATDPIDYVDKKVVTYPDYSRQGTPLTYMTSMYSGILFNAVC